MLAMEPVEAVNLRMFGLRFHHPLRAKAAPMTRTFAAVLTMSGLLAAARRGACNVLQNPQLAP
jgi:hypothetical protein